MGILKELVHPDRTQQSLIALKNELEASEHAIINIDTRIILFKINSCLYGQYPLKDSK